MQNREEEKCTDATAEVKRRSLKRNDINTQRLRDMKLNRRRDVESRRHRDAELKSHRN